MQHRNERYFEEEGEGQSGNFGENSRHPTRIWVRNVPHSTDQSSFPSSPSKFQETPQYNLLSPSNDLTTIASQTKLKFQKEKK